MSIIVQKYGGSSVATLQKIQAVAAKVAATVAKGHRVVVVVSAMGDTTDELLEMARQINPEPSRRELDMLLSVGERISMALLSMAMDAKGLDAISFTGSQSGIITTAGHSDARVIEVRPYRVQDELAAGRVVIVAGYQGVSYKREITTLGRGGSDTTAVALAAALSAEACEIYSDVDGVFDTDPRLVPQAQRLDDITYEEMQEMARLGAKVLHAKAVEFARASGIALYARSTHLTESAGTRIHHGGALRRIDGFEEDCARIERSLGVRAIASLKEGLWLSLAPSPQAAQGDNDAMETLLDTLASVEAPWCQLDEAGARMLLKLDDVHDLNALLERLQRATDGRLSVEHGVGLVSAVGAGVGERPNALLAAKRALRDAGLRPLAIQGSGHSVRCLLPTSAITEGVEALHKALIRSERRSSESGHDGEV